MQDQWSWETRRVSGMTKTPHSAAPCPDVSADMIHSFHWPTAAAPHAEQQIRAVAPRAAPPELVVTCEPCVAHNEHKLDHNTSGLSCGSQPDDESLCSDSGCGGSPASSLGLRKLSDCSSLGLSPTSSFEEFEEEFSANPEGRDSATRSDAVSS